MLPRDIPATEQLMGLTSEPQLPRDMRFVLRGLIWPAPEVLKNQSAQSALADRPLVDDTLSWIRRVLKPIWVAPDLSTRLIAAHAIIDGQDAFLARYVIDNTKVQIIVTKFHLHFVITPVSSPPRAALHEYLRVERPGDTLRWTGDPWQTSQVAGLDFGYMPRATAQDWRESVYFLTDGRAVKFSVEKLGESPVGSIPPKSLLAPTEEAERRWFNEQP